MDIAYGIEVQESGDRYISIAEEVIKAGSEAAIPGAFWVDFFPVLAYVPSWFPGAGFKRKAADWRKLNRTMVEKPFAYVQERLVRFFFSRMNLFKWGFRRKLARLRRRLQQPLLSNSLMQKILNGPWRKRWRKMWPLWPI